MISDHNGFADGMHWLQIRSIEVGPQALEKALARFGADWVEPRVEDGQHEVRIKPLGEYRTLFEERASFCSSWVRRSRTTTRSCQSMSTSRTSAR